jgi:hypothetical protein
MGSRRVLLTVDGLINIVLGVALMAFPAKLVSLLGVPNARPAFYPSVLGAVLVGIGIALILELRRPRASLAGLGLAGAVAINVSAGLVLAGWLVFGGLSIPFRGHVLLWGLVLVLVGLSGAELVLQWRHGEKAATSLERTSGQAAHRRSTPGH